MEQLVARRAHNPKVTGSSPVPATTRLRFFNLSLFCLQILQPIFFMFTVYVLYSPTFDKIYIGYTSNLEQRILSHNQLAKKGYTVKYRPWVVIHTEEFSSKADAMKREKQLKSNQGREFLWELIGKKYTR